MKMGSLQTLFSHQCLEKLSEKGASTGPSVNWAANKEVEKGLLGDPWGYPIDAFEAFRTVSRREILRTSPVRFSRNFACTEFSEVRIGRAAGPYDE
jgi:hypothetical protein